MVTLRVNAIKPLELVKQEIERMEKIKYAYVVTREYPLFIMAKNLNHQDSLSLIETLHNLPGVEEKYLFIILHRKI